jgi:hypothetical protein
MQMTPAAFIDGIWIHRQRLICVLSGAANLQNCHQLLVLDAPASNVADMALES